MRLKDCRKCGDYIPDRCLINTKCFIENPNNEQGLIPVDGADFESKCESCSNKEIDDMCERCGDNYLSYKPEEKPIEKIQMTEEQAEKMLSECFDFEQGYEKTKKNLKQAGYIRKTAVEEAEEMYEEFKTRVVKNQEYFEEMCRLEELAVKQHEAIQELKSGIERFKK